MMTARYILRTKPRWVGFKLTQEGEGWEREFDSIPNALTYARTLPDSQGAVLIVLDERGKQMANLTV
jgi:hypothetical protein